jgi:hypothetical protein
MLSLPFSALLSVSIALRRLKLQLLRYKSPFFSAMLFNQGLQIIIVLKEKLISRFQVTDRDHTNRSRTVLVELDLSSFKSLTEFFSSSQSMSVDSGKLSFLALFPITVEFC